MLALLEEIMEYHGAYSPEPDRLATTVSRIIAAPDHCFLLAESVPDEPDIAATAAEAGGAPAPDPAATTPATAAAPQADGHIVGMCALLFTLSTWSAAPVCELQDVIVTAASRREDIGRGLVGAAEQVARERGCARLQLLAESWNLAGHAFYRSLGLAEKTCLYFEKDLGGSDAG